MLEWIDVSGEPLRRPERIPAAIGVGLILGGMAFVFLAAGASEPPLRLPGAFTTVLLVVLVALPLRKEKPRVAVSTEAIRLIAGGRSATFLWSELSGIGVVPEPCMFGSLDWWGNSGGVLLLRAGLVDIEGLRATEPLWRERLAPTGQEVAAGSAEAKPIAPPGRWATWAAAFMALAPATALALVVPLTPPTIDRFVALGGMGLTAWFCGMIGVGALIALRDCPHADCAGVRLWQGGPRHAWGSFDRIIAVPLGPKCAVPSAWFPTGERPLLVRAGRTERAIRAARALASGTTAGVPATGSWPQRPESSLGVAAGLAIGVGGAMVVAVAGGAAAAQPWDQLATLLPVLLVVAALALVARTSHSSPAA